MTTTDVLGSAIMHDGEQIMLFGNGITDATGGHVYVRDLSGINTKDIGEYSEGKALRTLKLRVTPGSILTYIKIYDKKGATILYALAGELDAGARKNYNLVIRGLNIPMSKGLYLFAMVDE